MSSSICLGSMEWNYRSVPIGVRNFKGRHINEKVWNHLVTMLVDFGILQVTEDHYFFDPDIIVDEFEIVAHEFLHTYTSEHIHSWKKVAGCTFDRGSNFYAALEHFPRAVQDYSATCVAHRYSTAVKNACKDEECEYVKYLLKWARAFCKHILNHRLDEDFFERVQLESGRTAIISLKSTFTFGGTQRLLCCKKWFS